MVRVRYFCDESCDETLITPVGMRCFVMWAMDGRIIYVNTVAAEIIVVVLDAHVDTVLRGCGSAWSVQCLWKELSGC